MNDELVENFYGEMVPRSVPNVSTPKATQNPQRTKIKDMTTEERKQYNADRQAKHREKKRLAEDLLRDQEQIAQEAQRQEYHPEVVEAEYKPVPDSWTTAFDSFLDKDDTLLKIAAELNRTWLYSNDTQTIRDLQKLIFSVEHKYYQTDGEQLRTMGDCPDIVMQRAIKDLESRPHFNKEHDALDLRTSKTFMDLFTDSLWKANTLGCDPKYAPLLNNRMWSTVKAEFEKVCQS